MNWAQQIADCVVDDNKRHWLKGIPLWLIAAADYELDYIYWLEYVKLNIN